ncbi:MAG: TonB-dependent receptor, partial [Pseudomonadota bacterium]
FFEGRFDLIAQANGVESGFNVGGNVESTSYAAFAQLSYDITDTFTLTAGARYTDDEKEGNNIGFQFGLVYDDNVGESWNEFTYRVAVDWQVSPDTLLFASYSTGYKSGGINQIVVPSLGRNPIYDPESVSAIELGLKSTVLDGRLRINAALFRNEYDDLQFQVFELGGPSSFNADGAVVQGLEVELQAYVTESFAIDATLGLTDSEFDDQVLGGVDIGGNQVQRTPDVTFSIGVSNEWDFNTLGVLRARADVSYTDEIFYNAFNRAGGFSDPGGSDLAEDYTNVNLRLLWHDNDDKWNAEVFVTNLFDTVQEGNVFRGIGFLDVPGGGGPEQVTYNPPRQFGIQIGRKF